MQGKNSSSGGGPTSFTPNIFDEHLREIREKRENKKQEEKIQFPKITAVKTQDISDQENKNQTPSKPITIDPCPFLTGDVNRNGIVFKVFRGREDVALETTTSSSPSSSQSDSKFKWTNDLGQFQSSKTTPSLDYVVIGREVSVGGARIYMKAKYETYVERYEKMKPKNRHAHEQLDPRQLVRCIIDVEAPKFKNQEQFGTDLYFLEYVIYGHVVKVASRIIRKLYKKHCQNKVEDETFDPEEYTMKSAKILPSCSSSLYSSHAVLSVVYFTNMHSATCFCADLFYTCEKDIAKEWTEYEKAVNEKTASGKHQPKFKSLYILKNSIRKPLFDINLFRSMRLYGSSKLKDPNRVLANYVRYTREEYESNPYLKGAGYIDKKFNKQVFLDTLLGYVPPVKENQILFLIHYPVCYHRDASKFKPTYKEVEITEETITSVSSGGDDSQMMSQSGFDENSQYSMDGNTSNSFSSRSRSSSNSSYSFNGLSDKKYDVIYDADLQGSEERNSDALFNMDHLDEYTMTLYDVCLELVTKLYAAAGFSNYKVEIGTKIKLSEDYSRLVIPVITGVCLAKWFHSNTGHTNPNGLALIVDFDKHRMQMFCQKEKFNKRAMATNNGVLPEKVNDDGTPIKKKKKKDPKDNDLLWNRISDEFDKFKEPNQPFKQGGSSSFSESTSSIPKPYIVPLFDGFYERLLKLLPKVNVEKEKKEEEEKKKEKETKKETKKSKVKRDDTEKIIEETIEDKMEECEIKIIKKKKKKKK